MHANDVLKSTYIKNHKYTKSQSRLDIPTSIKFQGTSPKVFNTQIKTDRNKPGQENVEVSPFELNHSMKVQDYTLKVLTPSNGNIKPSEPKRHKILTKQRQLTFFE